jgi:hypothetical protein
VSVVETASIQGVAGFPAIFGWCFVVNLWWDAGENVVSEGHFFGVKKYANFSRFFW